MTYIIMVCSTIQAQLSDSFAIKKVWECLYFSNSVRNMTFSGIKGHNLHNDNNRQLTLQHERFRFYFSG